MFRSCGSRPQGCGLEEFASPPRGTSHCVTRVTTPVRDDFSATSRRLRQMSLDPEARSFKPKTPSASKIAFVQQNLMSGVIASPLYLEQLVGELELLSESDWPAHLAAAGGVYNPPFGMFSLAAKTVGISPRRGDPQLKRRMDV